MIERTSSACTTTAGPRPKRHPSSERIKIVDRRWYSDNHGYPGGLKIAIDTLRDEWRTKPVGFVSYGAAGGLRAVEQLRPVFAELHAVTMRDAVSFPSVHRRFDEYRQLLTVDHHATDHHRSLARPADVVDHHD